MDSCGFAGPDCRVNPFWQRMLKRISTEIEDVIRELFS